MDSFHPHRPKFPKQYNSPQSLTLSDPAFLAPQAAAGAVGGWVELGRTTLGSSSDTISVGSLADKRYYMVLRHHIATGGNIGTSARLNGDSAGNYTNRREFNGGTDTTAINSGLLYGLGGNAAEDNQSFDVSYLANLSAKEKLALAFSAESPATGAGTTASRSRNIGKHAQTSNPINAVSSTNGEAGSYATGSEIVVLGWDPDDTHTDNYWELLFTESGTAIDSGVAGIAAKKYLWIQIYLNGLDASSLKAVLNGVTGAENAQRASTDGSSDSTFVNNSGGFLYLSAQGGEDELFANMFVLNRSASEKLAIIDNVNSTVSGAATAPKRQEIISKWANTSAQITDIELTGTYGSNSIMNVYGAD